MFENNEAPLLVASLSPVIPHDAITKLAETFKPQFDIDELVNKVSEKLNTKKTESKEPENAGFKRFLF